MKHYKQVIEAVADTARGASLAVKEIRKGKNRFDSASAELIDRPVVSKCSSCGKWHRTNYNC